MGYHQAHLRIKRLEKKTGRGGGRLGGVPPLIGGRRLLAAAEEGVAAQGDDDDRRVRGPLGGGSEEGRWLLLGSRRRRRRLRRRGRSGDEVETSRGAMPPSSISFGSRREAQRPQSGSCLHQSKGHFVCHRSGPGVSRKGNAVNRTRIGVCSRGKRKKVVLDDRAGREAKRKKTSQFREKRKQKDTRAEGLSRALFSF